MATGESIVSRILKSGFFAKALGRAGVLVKNRALLLVMLQKGVKKLENKNLRTGLAEVKDDLYLLIRFARAYASGAYREVPLKSIVTVVGVLIYFISPLDLVPDILPVIGIADDVALVMWLFRTLEAEIGKFSDWEKKTKTINIG